jgi:hypothetical protein
MIAFGGPKLKSDDPVEQEKRNTLAHSDQLGSTQPSRMAKRARLTRSWISSLSIR